eukprot:789759-Pelagomonas_calceolata.AAC.3
MPSLQAEECSGHGFLCRRDYNTSSPSCPLVTCRKPVVAVIEFSAKVRGLHSNMYSHAIEFLARRDSNADTIPQNVGKLARSHKMATVLFMGGQQLRQQGDYFALTLCCEINLQPGRITPNSLFHVTIDMDPCRGGRALLLILPYIKNQTTPKDSRMPQKAENSLGGTTTEAVFAYINSCMGQAYAQCSSVTGKSAVWMHEGEGESVFLALCAIGYLG